GKPCNRTRFLWDGLRMIQETGTNQHRSLYIYTDQSSYEPLARIDKRGNDPERVMYFHTDLNGCPEELTDENGKILWECSFQLWGKRIHEIEHEPIEQNLRYQGQYLDRETGLHYNTFRYYDPDIGRFTQPDPIGLLGGFNLYQYAPNGLTWVDPWGLSPVSPKTVLFSQDDIGSNFSDKRSVNELIHRLKNDPSYVNNLEPIRKVRMRDLPADIQTKLLSQGAHRDSVFSLDNRRLYAAKEAGISKIPSRWATPGELSSDSLVRRFSTKTGGKSIKVRKCG
ncbi:RHS repeat domain-containing protein, partial [Snodgrassella alvi]|uniref:RHS repeat domain-containing protein n=2 Tax=Snodgrassella alvi TaxID=1196083 RepID=UPI00117AFC63